MPFRDPVQQLQDIVQNIDRVEGFTEAMDQQAFMESEETIFAVQYALLA